VQVTVERTQPCQARVSFTVPANEFESEFNKAVADFGQRVRMKGFRPGKVPADVVRKMQGPQLRHDVAVRFVQKAYEQAVTENKLRPFQHPQLDIGEVLYGADFTRQFDLNLRPEFELGQYKGLEIESALPPILDEEVEQAIEQARKNQAHPEPAGDAGLPEDGMALAKVELLHQGEVVWTREGLRLSPQATIPGVEAEALKGAMVGKRDGEVGSCPIHFPADFEQEAARDQDGECRITINQAYKVILPTREELMKMIGAADEAELLKRAHEGLEKANVELENQRLEKELIERVIGAHTMELPAGMVEDQTQARLNQIRNDLQQRGVSGAALEEQVAAQSAAAAETAVMGAKAYFLIERIAEAEKIQVAEAEMVNELRGIAQRNRSSFEEVRDFYQQQNLLPQLAMEILERKIRAFLRASANLVAPKV
jgi:trigger factor